ncbi:MAG: D-glycero-beta-D-manno-heptose 1-phosphate adenylyltransferase [Candidatus Zixiibacteriota bacterium]
MKKSKMGTIVNLDQLIRIRKRAKRNHQKVVFTNGCFDILHRGHIECLKKAKSLGDLLIVGLNSDSSVKKLKGDKRPIFPQKDRAEILASLWMVDYVCIFEEETPQKIISALIPDILVKGGDYKKRKIVGKQVVESHGGKVFTVKEVKGKSTKNIINRIAARYRKSSI